MFQQCLPSSLTGLAVSARSSFQLSAQSSFSLSCAAAAARIGKKRATRFAARGAD
jgi:hypothetical protein